MLLRKDWPQLAHTSHFIQTPYKVYQCGEEFQLPTLPCPCPSRQQTTHTNRRLWPWPATVTSKNPRFAGVFRPRSVPLQALTYTNCRFSRETTFLQGSNSQTISQPLLTDPSIAKALLKHFTQSQTQRLHFTCHYTVIRTSQEGWRDVSVLKSIYYSYRGQEFNSQNSHQAINNCL